MYNLQEISDRIRKTAKEKHIRLADLLISCGLSKNYVNQLPNNKDIKPGNIYLIARRLDVSLDYLLTGKEKSTTLAGAVLDLTPKKKAQRLPALCLTLHHGKRMLPPWCKT